MDTSLRPIVLAAGQGRRLSPVTGGVPKQFWSPAGRPSLLENTLERLQPLSPLPQHTTTVVDRTHWPLVEALGGRARLGRVVAQPMDRGTGAGVLLGLTEVLRHPDAIVVVTPSDHGVEDATLFRQGIREATAEIRAGRAKMVLFGVRPAAPAGDFGWVVPDARRRSSVLAGVRLFVEKPDTDRATMLFATGAVWSTMVVVAAVDALECAFHRRAPDVVQVFRRAARLSPARRSRFLLDAYSDIPAIDFSRDVLTHAPDLRLFVWPDRLGWTDLGTPDRLHAWLSAGGGPIQSIAAAGAA